MQFSPYQGLNVYFLPFIQWTEVCEEAKLITDKMKKPHILCIHQGSNNQVANNCALSLCEYPQTHKHKHNNEVTGYSFKIE